MTRRREHRPACLRLRPQTPPPPLTVGKRRLHSIAGRSPKGRRESDRGAAPPACHRPAEADVRLLGALRGFDREEQGGRAGRRRGTQYSQWDRDASRRGDGLPGPSEPRLCRFGRSGESVAARKRAHGFRPAPQARRRPGPDEWPRGGRPDEQSGRRKDPPRGRWRGDDGRALRPPPGLQRGIAAARKHAHRSRPAQRTRPPPIRGECRQGTPPAEWRGRREGKRGSRSCRADGEGFRPPLGL
jgi:hypothetical protein